MSLTDEQLQYFIDDDPHGQKYYLDECMNVGL